MKLTSEARRRISSTGPKGKQPVWGALERGGEVRTVVIPTTRKKDIQPEVRKHIAEGSNLYTDAVFSYHGMDEYKHQIIDHAISYVSGQVHTNGMENFWSLLKRGLKGTYVSVEPFHLFRYLDEQVFRYNNRKKPMDDGQRFEHVLSHVLGKRLTYAELTGKVCTTNN
jgi:transposase-like protein